MAIRKLLTVVVVLSLGVGAAAGTGVVDPVDVAQSQVCEPAPANVSQDAEQLSQDRLLNESDDSDEHNLTVRQNGTDGENMTVIEGSDLTSLAIEEISNDVCGTEQLAESVAD